ncbi:MAG: hypothetical protein CMF69_11015 [Magnetovibrio sp.]|nr:hypothetical protein [Magnetovibrio sp.]|tara:strand:+ start:530 stop:1837 length:1308 start_codon:yes stop_codon:yes gene_type:complete
MTDKIGTLDKKLLGDTAWNYGAFAALAFSGIILNLFITVYFGTEALGQFNQIYAVYIVTAQLAVFGVHESVQKYVAEHADNTGFQRNLSNTAFVLAGVIGVTFAICIWLVADIIGNFIESESVGKGLVFVAPGLGLFAINKISLAVLNGQRRMKAFAIIQGLRMLSVLAFAFFTAYKGWPAYVIGASFSVAEIIILGPLLALVKPFRHSFNRWEDGALWIKRHLVFGAKALPNGFLAESYIRIDVLILAILVDDRAIGIYSFASMFIEGLYQVPVVIRTVINPVLVRLVAGKDKMALGRFSRRIMLLSVIIFIIVAALVHLIVPNLAPFFPQGLVLEAVPILTTLTLGLVIYAAFVPLDFIIMQAGHPGKQSILMTINILISVSLNFWLIPIFGIEGAAMATAFTFWVSSLTLNAGIWFWLGMPGGLFCGSTDKQ